MASSRRLSGSAIAFLSVLVVLVLAYIAGAFLWGRGWWDIGFAALLAVLIVLFSFGVHVLAQRRGRSS